MKYKKRSKLEIQEYFNNFPKIVKDKRGFIEFLKHSAHNKSLLELKSEAIYDILLSIFHENNNILHNY